MNGKVPTLLLGALIALATVTCGGSDAELPQATQIVDVPVTRPADPTPVDVNALPRTARAVSQMPGLSDDEKLCANYAIKTTLDKDPSIEKTNGKMASVLGNSVVACTPPAKLATIVSGGVSENSKLSDEQRTCLEKTVAEDPKGTARFLSALLTLDIPTMTAASQHYDEVCKVQVAPS